MSEGASSRISVLRARAYRLIAAVVLSAAALGFLVELRRASPTGLGYAASSASLPASAPGALSYSELRAAGRGLTAGLYLSSAEVLRARLPALTEPLVRKEGDRAEMLSKRASRRAFDGAPPVVPHPVDERSAPNCLVCHERGAKIADLVAPAMSHRAYSSCSQCHVSKSGSAPGDATKSDVARSLVDAQPALSDARAAVNEFAPLPYGGPGERAWPGAPPTIPHGTWMRETCESCHGVSGHPGLRTSHAERHSCTQCHVPKTTSDQMLTRFAHHPGGLP